MGAAALPWLYCEWVFLRSSVSLLMLVPISDKTCLLTVVALYSLVEASRGQVVVSRVLSTRAFAAAWWTLRQSASFKVAVHADTLASCMSSLMWIVWNGDGVLKCHESRST